MLVLRSHSRMIKNISAVAIENFCESIDFAAPVTYTVPCAEINGGSVREINKHLYLFSAFPVDLPALVLNREDRIPP